MNEPSCRRVRADWRVAWVYLIGAGLLLLGWQAGAVDASAQQDARREAIELLRRSQNESGRRSVYLPQAYERIQLGLAASKDDPLQQGQWLEALWEYHLLNDDHAQARQALERSLQLLTAARADASHIDRVACNLSYSLILLGEVAQAKDLLRRAIVSATQHNNRRPAGRALLQPGRRLPENGRAPGGAALLRSRVRAGPGVGQLAEDQHLQA